MGGVGESARPKKDTKREAAKSETSAIPTVNARTYAEKQKPDRYVSTGRGSKSASVRRMGQTEEAHLGTSARRRLGGFLRFSVFAFLSPTVQMNPNRGRLPSSSSGLPSGVAPLALHGNRAHDSFPVYSSNFITSLSRGPRWHGAEPT